MSDIVERLLGLCTETQAYQQRREAAAEIERLRALLRRTYNSADIPEGLEADICRALAGEQSEKWDDGVAAQISGKALKAAREAATEDDFALAVIAAIENLDARLNVLEGKCGPGPE